eukprot:TRINITY_DN18193_c0_g1_i2.p1 TRINITY_DN18193_c0_g1~~TRINITY_DN18193_c0_g1_i2.p1  ORF type:complete len:368 (+),score=133.55 TRINITY_DN18193_c0_g1_i2:59-1162(+)
MVFVIRTCADLHGKKVNLELPFPGKPSRGEVQRKIDEVFTHEMRVLYPNNNVQYGSGQASFFVTSRMQIYDDRHLKWTDLISDDQIVTDRCQVYAFRESLGSPTRDVQQEMPAPRAPSLPQPLTDRPQPSPETPPQYGTSSPLYGSGSPPQQHYDASPARPPPTGAMVSSQRHRPNVPLQDKINTTFYDFNGSKSGALSPQEMAQGFRNADIDFATITLDELFSKADRNRDSKVTPDEWQAFCALYPNTIDCVYFRTRDKAEEDEVNGILARLDGEQQQMDAREQQLHRELADIQMRKQEVGRQLDQYRAKQAQIQQKKDTLEQQERDLMEQEIRLERQRDHLRAQEQRFQQAANNFDRATEVSTKP